jgi:hypothetical protein
MENIAIKFAELTQRAVVLEGQIAERCRCAGRQNADQAIAAMQKRLSSLRRSCQILARHLSTCSGDNAFSNQLPPVAALGCSDLGVHLPGALDLSSSGSHHAF